MTRDDESDGPSEVTVPGFVTAALLLAALVTCCVLPDCRSDNARDDDRREMAACAQSCGERGMARWARWTGCECRAEVSP